MVAVMTKRPIDISDIEQRVEQARQRYFTAFHEHCSCKESEGALNEFLAWERVLERVRDPDNPIDPLIAVLERE